MTAHAAVGIDDDLASGQAGIAHRAADNKPAGGIDVVLGVGIQQVGGNDGLNDVLQNVGAQFSCPRSPNAGWKPPPHRRAATAVARRIPRSPAICRRAAGNRSVPLLRTSASRWVNLWARAIGSRHQLLVLVAGITEHHALIARPAGINAHGDIAGLFVDAEMTAQVSESKP